MKWVYTVNILNNNSKQEWGIGKKCHSDVECLRRETSIYSTPINYTWEEYENTFQEQSILFLEGTEIIRLVLYFCNVLPSTLNSPHINQFLEISDISF